MGIKDGACAIFGDLSLFLQNKTYKNHATFKNFLNLDSFANGFILLEDDCFLKQKPFSITMTDFARVFDNTIIKDQSLDSLNEENNYLKIEQELQTDYCQELKIMRQNTMEEIINFSEQILTFPSDMLFEFKSFVFSLLSTWPSL